MARYAGCLLLASLPGSAAATGGSGPQGWPASLEFIHDGSDGEFFDFVVPLSNMTRFSYTATWGSYYRAGEASASHPGWSRGALEANPRGGGMRALTFLQPATSRGVVAFRGTDLNRSTVSGHADACANDVLAGSPLPEDCHAFSKETLDYLTRALAFAEAAAEEHPGIEWLFTGHSLGALLAEAVAAVRGRLALVFSAPPVTPVLLNRTAVSPGSVSSWAVAALFAEYDPLRYKSEGELPGASCVWPSADVPPGCAACELGGHKVDLSRPPCRQCFLETHVFAHYLQLVRSRRRPECRPAAFVATRAASPLEIEV